MASQLAYDNFLGVVGGCDMDHGAVAFLNYNADLYFILGVLAGMSVSAIINFYVDRSIGGDIEISVREKGRAQSEN